MSSCCGETARGTVVAGTVGDSRHSGSYQKLENSYLRSRENTYLDLFFLNFNFFFLLGILNFILF